MPRLRTDAKQLIALLERTQNPVYVLNESREVIYCNAACEAWLGIPRDQLVGTQCSYGGDAETPPAAAALCPSPDVFQGVGSEQVLVWRGDDGTVTERQAQFIPLGDDSECVGVVAIVSAREGVDSREDKPLPGALELHRQLQRLCLESSSRYRLERIVGNSLPIRRAREQARIAIESRARCEIVGPTGSGREFLARTIHAASSIDHPAPLLPVSCELLDAELLQATLVSFLARCHAESDGRGTILLLEVDQLSAAGQIELQGFLGLPTVELATVATASRPLSELAGSGAFVEPLASTLSGLTINLPALADRREDVPLLIQQQVEYFNTRGAGQLTGFAPDVLDRLCALPWQRNLEELAEVVQEACEKAAGPWIQEADLPERVGLIVSAAMHPNQDEESIVLDDFLADAERELIERALRKARGNKAKAARLLGIQRARLLRRIAQLEIEG